MNVKKLLKTDWEIVAGLLAAVGVIVLKFLHIVDEETMLTLAIVLLAGLFLRELRRELVFDKFAENLNEIEASVKQLTVHYADQGSTLVTPSAMNDSMCAFSQRAKGVCVFKHVSPFMFNKVSHFNGFLKPMLEHDAVSEVIFIINDDEKDDYNRYVKAKIDTCDGATKVAEVITAENTDGNGIIAFNCGLSEGFEALITFFSEPFMVKYNENWVPKFAMHVLPDSEVAKIISDNIRKYLAFS
jgi:hypothetical protein